MRPVKLLGGLVALLALAGPASADSTAPAPGTVAPSLVLVCTLAPQGAPASTYCPNDANGNAQAPSVVQGYLMSPAQYADLQAAIAPLDVGAAAGAYSIGLFLVVSTYLAALPLGMLVRGLTAAR